jgi:DNA-binding SARP family transcriptional activator
MLALCLLKLSSVYSAMGEVAEAGALARQGLEVVPDSADVIRLRLEGNLAVCETWTSGRLNEVVAACRRIAVESASRGLDHYAAIANHNLGMVLRQMGRLQESADVLERSARFWDSDMVSPFADHSELVQTLLALGDVAMADSWNQRGQRATRPWPRPHAESKWAAAAVLAARGRFAEAIEILEALRASERSLGAVAGMVTGLLAECEYLRGGGSDALRSLLPMLRAPVDPRLVGLVAPARALATHWSEECDGACLAVDDVLRSVRSGGAEWVATVIEVKVGPLVLDHAGAAGVDRVTRALSAATSQRSGSHLRFWLREYRRHASLLLATDAGRELLLRLVRLEPDFWGPIVLGELGSIEPPDRRDLLAAIERHATTRALEGLPAQLEPDIAEVRRALTRRHAARIWVRSLGLLAIHRNGWSSTPAVLGKRRLALLLGLLLAHHRGTLPRDQVLNVLWPESDPEAALNSLNQSVFQLRRHLDHDYRDRESPSYIMSSGEAIGLDPELVRTDIDEFRAAGRLLHESVEAPARRGAAEAMIGLARGEFLTELRYEDWVVDAQASVHAELRLHLLPLARGEIDIPADLGIRAASALIDLDRFDEEAHLALVDRLLQSGRRSAARDALRRFARLMAREFDEEPTPEMLTALALVRLDPSEVNLDLTLQEEGLTFGSGAL